MGSQLQAAKGCTEADLAKARTKIRLSRKENEKAGATLRGLKDDLNTDQHS